jgi:hypothetical protein
MVSSLEQAKELTKASRWGYSLGMPRVASSGLVLAKAEWWAAVLAMGTVELMVRD